MKIKDNFKVGLILVIVLLLALFLRVYGITSISLYGDELTLVYDAYSIYKTNGFDQTGEFLPLTFSMGAGRPAGYVYGSIPFVAIFGPSELGARGLSILSGIGIVLLFYLIGRRLFSKKLGIVTAFLAAISPWEINLSRGGFEAHFALFLSLLGIYFLFSSAKRFWLLTPAALSFGLAIHTYPTYKLTLPLFFLILIWFMRSEIRKVWRQSKIPGILALSILALSMTLAIAQTIYGNSEERFFRINAFSQEKLADDVIQKINNERKLNQLPANLANLFHNKFVEYGKIIGEGYLQNFSANFLFFHGDGNPRHNMANIGGFWLSEMVLILLGLGFYLRQSKSILVFLISWILIAPIPTSILIETHALRSSFMLPPFIFLSSGGILLLLSNFKKIETRIICVTLLVMILIQFLYFVNKIYFLAPNKYASFWSDAAKQASLIISKQRTNFDNVIVSDRIDNIEYAYPVYLSVDPKEVIEQNKQRTTLGNYRFKKFDNIFIGSIPPSEIENFISSQIGSSLYIGPAADSLYLTDYSLIPGKDGLDNLVIKRVQQSNL